MNNKLLILLPYVLGVYFDRDLSFVLHCQEKINKDYAMLGIMRRNFMYLSEEAFVYYTRLMSDHNWNMLILYGIKYKERLQTQRLKLRYQHYGSGAFVET